MKPSTNAMICVLSVMIVLPAIGTASATNPLEVIPTDEHHVIELNSDQPYVAGFHVKTADLRTRCTLNATSITVCFSSVDANAFPATAWLGGGMFVQAQDSKFLHVDYGFYTMLVFDAEARLFVDVGLYQTREISQPFQNPPSELIYAYTWRVVTPNTSIPITLSAHWDCDGTVHYFMLAQQTNLTLASLNIPSLPYCQNIIRRFYAGNAVANPFPVSTYVHYFQFGVVSPQIISGTPWVVSLKNPMMFKTGWTAALGRTWREEETGWGAVDHAWAVHGDNAFLDADWSWGGKPYFGVDAQAQHILEDLREVLFSYTGRTLEPGTALWDGSNPAFSDVPFQAGCFPVWDDFGFCFIVLGLLGITILGKCRMLNS